MIKNITNHPKVIVHITKNPLQWKYRWFLSKSNSKGYTIWTRIH